MKSENEYEVNLTYSFRISVIADDQDEALQTAETNIFSDPAEYQVSCDKTKIQATGTVERYRGDDFKPEPTI